MADDQSLNYWGLAEAEQVWQAAQGYGAEGAALVWNTAAKLSPDDRRRFLWGKRGALYMLVCECSSRSGAYEVTRAAALACALRELGLVRDGPHGNRTIDVRTGRRVATRLRELARLGWDWGTPDNRAWLTANWGAIVDDPLDSLKTWVRDNNPHAKG